jgi:hypothetical protein
LKRLHLSVKQKAEGGQAADETRDLENTPEESARTGQAGKILDNSYARTLRLTHLGCQRFLRLLAQVFGHWHRPVFGSS